MGDLISCGTRVGPNPQRGWTRSIIAESTISIAIDFEWDFFKLLLLWL